MSSRSRTPKKSFAILLILVACVIAALFYFGWHMYHAPQNGDSADATKNGIVITDDASAPSPAATAATTTTPANTADAATNGSSSNSAPIPTGANTVTIDGNVIDVDVSSTTAAIDQGLQYYQNLGENQGMIFLFDHAAKFRFWMPNMNFALDMIWIGSNMKVVDITKDAPPLPNPSNPVWFSPSTPAQYVLEVNAGYADSHNIKIGDTVTFSLQS